MERTDTRTVGSYPDYLHAQQAVDALADRDFPVEHTAIVASDLRMVEQVTGRRTFASSAARSAATGGLIAALVGFLLGSFSVVDPLVSALALGVWGFLLGALIGAVIGAIGHAASAGRRDFHSFGRLAAGRYDVVCDVEMAHHAEQLLSATPSRTGADR